MPFQHSLMNLGVETHWLVLSTVIFTFLFQHSLMNLGVETQSQDQALHRADCQFQHSLMNLGVETLSHQSGQPDNTHVSAFSDESWGGDPHYDYLQRRTAKMFQHSLMNLGVETHGYISQSALKPTSFSIL